MNENTPILNLNHYEDITPIENRRRKRFVFLSLLFILLGVFAVVSVCILFFNQQAQSKQIDQNTADVQRFNELVNQLAQTVYTNVPQTCKLQCRHNGTPNTYCSACICSSDWEGVLCDVPASCNAKCADDPSRCLCYNGGILDKSTCSCHCLIGWEGPTCTEVQNNVTVGDMISALHKLLNSTKELPTTRYQYSSSLSAMHNLGSGVTAEKSLTRQVLLLSPGEDQVRHGNDILAIPKDATLTLLPGGEYFPQKRVQVYRTYEEFLDEMLQPRIDGDRFAVPFSDEGYLQHFYDKFFTGDTVFVIAQQLYSLYRMELSHIDAPLSYELHPIFQRSVDYIQAVPYDDKHRPFYFAFFDSFGVSVVTKETRGGAREMQTVVDRSLYDIPMSSIGDFVKRQATIELNSWTGQPNIEKTDTTFTSRATTTKICRGGNSDETQCSSGDWSASLWTQSVPVELVTRPITDFIVDKSLKGKLQLALSDYMNVTKMKWNALLGEKCPDCNGHGTCSPGNSYCDCTGLFMGRKCSTCVPPYYGPNCDLLYYTAASHAPGPAARVDIAMAPLSSTYCFLAENTAWHGDDYNYWVACIIYPSGGVWRLVSSSEGAGRGGGGSGISTTCRAICLPYKFS